MYEKLVDLLRSEALEEEKTWTITTFYDFIAVEATTKKTAPDRHVGWQLANSLCDAVLERGYEFSSAVSRLGTTRKRPATLTSKYPAACAATGC